MALCIPVETEIEYKIIFNENETRILPPACEQF